MSETWMTAAEIAKLKLPGLPGDRASIWKTATREGWPNRPREASGGGREYPVSTLPKAARDALLTRAIAAPSTDAASLPVPVKSAPPAPVDPMVRAVEPMETLQGWQKRAEEARVTLLAEARHFITMGLAGSPRAALMVLADTARDGTLRPDLMALIPLANQRGGRTGSRTLSYRTLARWWAAKDAKALAPKATPSSGLPAWAPALMGKYARPSKPSLAWAVEQLERHPEGLPDGVAPPTYDQARKWLAGVSSLLKFRGRLGPRALKSIRTYVSRSVDDLWPTAIYTADGHTLDSMVLHPRTGKPFRPEVTTVIDVFTRKAVGWSVALSENTWGVLEALVNAIERNGLPDIWYVDRGKGFNNPVFDASLSGMLARLGITKIRSLPYNSQARGVIERSHQTIWVRGAKTMVTYMGGAMDDEARQKVHKAMQADVKATGTTALAMAWADFMVWAEEQVQDYNARPHSFLSKITDPQTGRRRHMSPDEAWEAHRVTGWSEDRVEAEDLSALFRPAIKRKTNRGLIDLFGNTYHHSRLEHWHGEDVLVAYDIHDAGKVWVHEIDRTADGYYMGRLICVAAWNAHVASYYPVSLAEKSHQQKIDMKTKRFQVHMDRAEEERRPILVDDGPADMDPDVAEAVEAMGKALEAPEVADRPRLTLVTDEPPPSIAAPKPEALADPDARPKLTDDISWARWLMDNPERWEKHDHEGMAELCRDRGFRLLAGTKGLDLTALDALVRAKRAEASQPDTEDQKECADHAS